MIPTLLFSLRLQYLIGMLFLLVFIGGCQKNIDDSSTKSKFIQTTIAEDTLSLGSISNVVQNEQLNYTPFINFLSDSLKELGITHIRLEVVRSIDEMIDLIKKGKIDFYADSPYPAATVLKSTDMIELFLKQYKGGAEYYNSVIFVRKDSGINSISELKGKLVGFEKKYSTSGYVLPYNSLSEMGLKFNYIEFQDTPLKSTQINYIFTGDDENTMYWVLSKKIDAGVSDNISFFQYAGASSGEIKIIYESEKVPRHLVMVRKSLDEKIKERLYSLLLNMDDYEYGRVVLKNYFGSAKFDTLNSFDIFSINKF